MAIADIVFTGVCAIVAANAGDNGRPIAAVMPYGADFNPAHHAYLLVAQLDGAGRPNTFDADPPNRVYVREDRDHAKYWYVQFDHESLEVTDLKSRSFVIDDDEVKGDDHKPTVADDLPQMHWVPRLENIWPGSHALPMAWLTTNPGAGEVSLRMEMPYGHLSVRTVEGFVWRAKPKAWWRRNFDRAYAQEVQLEVETDGNYLTLVTRDLTSGQKTGTFKIGSNEKIFALIGNTPDNDVLPDGTSLHNCGDETQAARLCPLGQADPFPCTCIDHHFSLYYEAFSDKPAMANRPLPHRIETFSLPVGQFHKLGGANCPPILYGF